jgi:beta-1,2-rhamnosyltransferase WsaF-like protein
MVGRRRDSADGFERFRPLTSPALVTGPTPRHDPARDGDGRLVVLLPHLNLDRMSGGPNTVFQVTARVLHAGIKLRYAATTGPLAPDPAALRDHILRVTGIEADPEAVEFVDASAHGATLDLGRDDVIVATWWRTAHMANECLDHVRAREFIYLIQDFEPGFYPWSTKSALAESTYNLPIRALVNEPLLERYLRQAGTGRFGSDALIARTFMPAVDRAVFARHGGSPTVPRRLLFYARPRNPRNLFEIGLRVLREAALAGVFDGDRWEFLALGQELPDLPLSPRHVLRFQPWLRYEDYGALLGSSDVLLSLMLSPHTSYPPLEMAAAGGLVVTNTYGPKTSAALAAISPAIHAAAPEVEPLVEALRETVLAVSRPRSTNEVAPLALPGTWDEALRDALPWLVQQVRDLRAT